MNYEFPKLNKQDKVNFFLKCQELLAKYHPRSHFLVTDQNLAERTATIKDLTTHYKGYVWQDDHCCVLWNKIKIADPKDPIAALKAHKYQPPDPMYNGVAIDFLVMDDIKNLLNFCKTNFDKNMLYCLYVKGAKSKIFRTDTLMANVLKIPVASPPLIKL